ncbi:MAG: rhomboid family intramembrane serine protease [Cytophagales bacterium]|nr:rhomboid family intramembrane serine protease [Cytophagales bacterium]
MANSILQDIKNMYNRPNNGLIKIIIINVCVFLIMHIPLVFMKWFKLTEIYLIYRDIFSMPANIMEFLLRPWTLFIYFFSHADIQHILFNMLFLYWFGNIINSLVGNSKVIAIYVLGGLAGAVFYFLAYYSIPSFIDLRSKAEVIGASGAVYAMVIGAATLSPNYEINLLFIRVKIKWIALVYVVISFLGTGGGNAGGNAVHLGGALLGFLFIKQLQQGNDWSGIVMKPLTVIENLFAKKDNLNVSYRNSHKNTRSQNIKKNDRYQQSGPTEAEIDHILDKISRSGYESLTKEEQQLLWQASKKGNRPN